MPTSSSENKIPALRAFLVSNTYSAIRLGGVLTTLLLLFGYQYLPGRKISLLPSSDYISVAYQGAESQLLEGNNNTVACEFKETETYSCGLTISLTSERDSGLDLRDFDGILIRASYEGTNNRFRITMRNHNSVYSRQNPMERAKFLLTLLRSSDFDRSSYIKLGEFSVAEWWIRQYDIPREHAAPEFSNVMSIGFDFVDPGHQKIVLQEVTLVGAFLSKEALYLSVLLVWMCVLMSEGIHRFILVYLDSKRANKKIGEMTESMRKLEIEKNQYEVMSTTDALTGIANRTGIDHFARKIFKSSFDKSHLGMILFDIDHFKRINDTRGHDTGDRVLQGLARIISANIREVDVFGRWGGEEFIIISPQVRHDSLLKLAEKLRLSVAAHTFETDQPLNVTVSMGAVAVATGESFEEALKRADLALYQAKNQGRNCVVPG